MVLIKGSKYQIVAYKTVAQEEVNKVCNTIQKITIWDFQKRRINSMKQKKEEKKTCCWLIFDIGGVVCQHQQHLKWLKWHRILLNLVLWPAKVSSKKKIKFHSMNQEQKWSRYTNYKWKRNLNYLLTKWANSTKCQPSIGSCNNGRSNLQG